MGFGNFGEYNEAKKYFTRAIEIEPDNFVTKNYLDYLEKITKKFPAKSTEKPVISIKTGERIKYRIGSKLMPAGGHQIK